MSSADIFYFIEIPEDRMYKRPNEQHERIIAQMEKDEKTQKTTEEKTKQILNSVINQNNKKYGRFATIVDNMLQTYKAKNSDYGDSFSITVKKYGLITALTRMSDKFNRIEQLIMSKEDPKVKDESLRDTLIDLASYAIMTVMELEDKEWKDF